MASSVTAVVDASVVLKWVLPEPGRAAAVAVLDAFETGALNLLAPRVLMEEVASALTKHHRRRTLTRTGAERAFAWVSARQPLLEDDAGDVETAFALSLQHGLSLWDSLYLALAIRVRCDLLTADRRFFAGVSRHYPFTRLIAAPPL